MYLDDGAYYCDGADDAVAAVDSAVVDGVHFAADDEGADDKDFVESFVEAVAVVVLALYASDDGVVVAIA